MNYVNTTLKPLLNLIACKICSNDRFVSFKIIYMHFVSGICIYYKNLHKRIIENFKWNGTRTKIVRVKKLNKNKNNSNSNNCHFAWWKNTTAINVLVCHYRLSAINGGEGNNNNNENVITATEKVCFQYIEYNLDTQHGCS